MIRPCECGCGHALPAEKKRFIDIHHYRRSPQFKAQRHAASLKAKADRDRKRAGMALSGFGRLTDREMRIYTAGHHNGYSSGYDRGRRKGYADACGEQEDALTEAQIEARRKGGLALAAKRRAA